MPINLFIRLIVIALAALLFAQSVSAQPLDQRLQSGFEAGELPGLHGAIVTLADQELAEIYFAGEDELWGRKLGLRVHGPDTLHDLRSVTKSIVGLIYGIALDEGKVPSPDQSLYAQFPQYSDLHSDKDRKHILVEHALSMQMGLEWNEDLPYSDPRNSEIAMENAPDRYRYILEQPIVEAPGKTWKYSGGAVALLAKLVEQGTGMPLDVYAEKRLFAPLGITKFEWVSGADGVPSAASGLRLTLPDLAKIGKMVAQGGQYDQHRIVPSDWLDQSFKSRVKISQYSDYGYLWYLSGPSENFVAIAVGNGGQRLTIQPRFDLVVASFAGRYNDPESWQTSLKVVLEFAVPAAKQLLAEKNQQ